MSDYKAIKEFGKEIMERYGWKRIWNLNAATGLPKDAAGLSDQGWVHQDRKLLVFVEEKYGADTLSDAQIKFWCRLLAGKPYGVFYALVSSEDDWQAVAELARS